MSEAELSPWQSAILRNGGDAFAVTVKRQDGYTSASFMFMCVKCESPTVLKMRLHDSGKLTGVRQKPRSDKNLLKRLWQKTCARCFDKWGARR